MTVSLMIHSFKGGTGKSTTVAQLAVCLALEGKKVGVLDMDLAGPGLHVVFQLSKEEIKYTLNDVLLLRCSTTQAVIDLTARLGLKKGSLLFVPASYKAEDIVRILSKGYEVNLFKKVMDEISETFNLDYLLVDARPGIDESTLIGLASSDDVFVISRADNQDIFGTGVILEVTKTLKKPVYIILNMLPAGSDMNAMKERIEKLYGVPVKAVIQFYIDVLKHMSAGVFMLKEPEHDFSLSMKSLAKDIMEMPR